MLHTKMPNRSDALFTLLSHISMFLILQDFATSSLQGEVAESSYQSDLPKNDLKQYQIVERKSWEKRYYLLIDFMLCEIANYCYYDAKTNNYIENYISLL